jgi:putative transposase
MGIKNNLTLSNGLIFNASVQETDRLKKLQRQLEKKKKGSKNRNKQIKKIKVEYQKIANQKNELANKILNHLNNS